MPPVVVFRVDASHVIGSGHVMRCLTLARRLARDGARVSFICREGAGDLCAFVENDGIALDRLPPRSGTQAATQLHPEALDTAWLDDAEASVAAIRARHGRADWIVVDHYGFDHRWEAQLRPVAANVLAIDDLANRRHDCDVLLDQNIHVGLERRYDGLLPDGCRRLLGPRYALLRPEFALARSHARARDGQVRRLLVFFGGVDLHDATSKCLEALGAPGRGGLAIDAIVGASNPHADRVQAACGRIGATLHRSPPDIAALMSAADLAIGATGATSWERLCVGLPAIVMTLAPNQVSGERGLEAAGMAVGLGPIETVTTAAIAGAVEKLRGDPARVRAMSLACAEAVDGRGADRVARTLDARPIVLRPAEASDRDAIYAWRNDEDSRRYSHSSAPIAPEAHAAWFERVLADPDRVLVIGACEGEPVGVLRYDCAGQQSTVSIYLVPGRHGHGFGARLLFAGHAWLRSHRPHVRSIRAEVLPENRASAVVFREAGYRNDGEDGIYVKELG